MKKKFRETKIGKFFNETKLGGAITSVAVGLVEGYVPGVSSLFKSNKESDLGATEAGKVDLLRAAAAFSPYVIVAAALLVFLPEAKVDLFFEYVGKAVQIITALD